MSKKSDDELEKRIKAILGDFDPTTPPPKIDPVPRGIKRPTWSVMIPTYNCAKYLTKTLETVLEQDPGPEHMQIEVVDDCSTLDDPEKVVREVGKGRVGFHKNEINSGNCTINFNICIERSRGNLLHILHGDDYVLNGFYNEIENMSLSDTTSMFYSTRSLIIDEKGFITDISNRIKEYEGKATNGYYSFINNNPLVCPSIVLKRSFYERYGGFIPSLLHCADWEMWVRATTTVGLLMSFKALAAYRMSEYNDTSKFVRNGEYLKENLKLFLILNDTINEYPLSESLKSLCSFAQRKEQELKDIGDIKSALKTRVILNNILPLLSLSNISYLKRFFLYTKPYLKKFFN
jgi:glycosyltransferase involved in cell wall biosynthesis